MSKFSRVDSLMLRGDARDVSSDDAPGKVWKRVPKKGEVIVVQLATGKIHRDPTHIAHHVDTESAYVGDKLVAWRESFISSLDALKKRDIQDRAGAELDYTSLIVRYDGVTVSALYGCWVNRHMYKLFSLSVALLLRHKSVIREEGRDLNLG